MISARFTNPEHTLGELVIDGVSQSGPLPPNAADLRAIFDAWVAAGGIIDPYVAPPSPVPQVPVDLDNFVSALQAEGIVTAAKATNIRNRLKK